MKKITVFLITILILLGIFIYSFSLINLFKFKTANVILENKKDINLYLKWLNQAQFAGNYVAKENKYYEDAGLNVNIIPFDMTNSPINRVIDDKDISFGITGSDQLILARNEGAKIKAIAVIYKTSPSCIYSLKNKNIITPKDLIGKTVGIEKGTNIETGYYLMLKKLKINQSLINEKIIGYDAKEVLDGSVDASMGYIINEPYEIINQGKEINSILLSDYGVDIYADVIFTTEENIKNNPEIINKFLSSTIKGWEYAINYPEDATEKVLLYSSTKNKVKERYMLEKSMPLIYNGISPIGWMDKQKWIKTQETLMELNSIDNIEEINNYYTNEFIEKIYQGKNNENLS
ncbi:MAG: ABC transporter substrate-binding protein [Candidatus Pacearchaeota archaeon]|jgi:ABC-type nitrate/sulfonate/bicarbonate transport system substrate-binding protein